MHCYNTTIQLLLPLTRKILYVCVVHKNTPGAISVFDIPLRNTKKKSTLNQQ